MRVAIVDDIKAEQEFLGRCLNRYCTEQLVPCEAATFDSGSAFIKNGIFDYDLIFLDIYMPGLNGLDTAARIREINKDVLLIFTTTSADFAVKSYRVRAFDYLVKPFTYDQFAETLRLATKALAETASFITLKTGRSQTRVLLHKILYVDYSNHYIQLHTETGEIIASRMYFEEITKILDPYPQLLYCSRNCIINMDKVTRLEKTDFILSSGECIAMNRNTVAELRQKYADYIFQKQNGGTLL